jgi:hypothetical protein
MLLLDGATISIRYDSEAKKYTATAAIGSYSKTAIASDPVEAIGLACMLQAGYTESKLKKELVG